MLRIALALSFALASTMAHAQSFGEYMKLRKQHAITQPAAVAALETLVGERVLEIKGIVKGTFRVGDRGAIMLEGSSGNVQVVDCDAIPGWLVGNEVAARLIIRANRAYEGGDLQATLLGAATEADLSSYERRTAPKPSRSAALTKPTAAKQPKKDWVLPASEVTPIYAGFIKKYNRRLSDREAYEIATGIVGFSLHYGVDARLIMAMVIVESGFNPGATSHAGAMGLGQLMPGTAAGMGITNAYDKMQNLYGTVRLIRGHLDKYKKETGQDFASLVLALAAYNAGGGAVKRHGGVPPYRETQNYIRKVIATYQALAGQN